jgi:hypothetical protein
LNRHITKLEQMMEQILENLLAGQEQMVARMKAEMEAIQEEVMAEMKASHEEITRPEAKIDSHNEKFEVLPGTFVSRIDAHGAKTEANPEELIDTVKASHERIEALSSISQVVMEVYPEIMEVNPAEMKS